MPILQMYKLRPERFRHVFNAAYRVNSGERNWTSVPLLQIVLFPPSPSVAEVHGQMTGSSAPFEYLLYSVRWTTHSWTVPKDVCPLPYTYWLSEDWPKSTWGGFLHHHWPGSGSNVQLHRIRWDSRHLSWRKYIILQGQFKPLCTCQSWKKERKRGQIYLGPN